MNNKHLVIHTYCDTEMSEIFHRPFWKSEVKSYPSADAAYKGMNQAISKYNPDAFRSVYFDHDCAVLEYADGDKAIWTITEIGG